MPYATINPFTNEVVATFPSTTAAEVDTALEDACRAFARWRTTPIADRQEILGRAAALMLERSEELARLSTLETGHLLSTTNGEVHLAASILQHYADNAAEFLAPETVPTPGSPYEATVEFEPTGIILAIEPWNAPFYQPIRAFAPHVAAGNVMLLKHAGSVPQCAAAVQQIMDDAGIPRGVFTNLYLDYDQIERVIRDPRVTGVTLTGSESAGAKVAAIAGSELKKIVLELGGSDAMVVLEDADLDLTVSCAINGRTLYNGQVCISPKRMIVVDSLYDAFLERLLAAFSGLRPGNPFDADTSLAPLASQAAADGVREQIRRAVEHGATATEVGGKIPAQGAFVQPVVLTDVSPDNPVFHEEIFGPVPTVFHVADETEAVRLANDSPYGLGGSVYSRDIERARAVASRIETGMVWINSPTGTAADLPFHGIKRSGFGVELGREGIREFVNPKLVVQLHS